jgi:hypothetical protein
MRRTFALIIAVGLMAALLALPGAALGRAAFTEYTATETQIGGPDFDPATDWTKPIIQARFASTFVDLATDPRASGTTEVSGKITFTEFNPFVSPPFMVGIMSGTSVTYVSGDGYEGTWVGHWQGKLTGFGSFYKAIAHGTGDLAGMKMMMTYDSTRDPVITGRLLDPHGG